MPPMKTGIPLALASAVLFGASTPFAKLLLGTVDPWLMAGLLFIGAGLGLAIIHLSRGVLRLPAIEAPLRRPDLPWLAAVILFGGVLGPLLLMLGLARADAAAASLLLNLRPRDHGHCLGRVPGECRSPPSARRFRHPGGSRSSLLAGSRVVSMERIADRGCMPLLGHRQQSHAQAFLLRPGADCHDQGPHCRRGKLGASHIARCCNASGEPAGGRRSCGVPRLWREPCALRARSALSRRSAHGCVFFTSTFRGSGARGP